MMKEMQTMKNQGLLYLATPYSHDDPDVMLHRYKASCRAAAKLLKAGIAVFNPLANTIPAVELGGLELTHDEFLALDLEILRRCDELLIVCLENWQQSAGVRTEMFEMIKRRMPITLIDEADIENLPVIPKGAKTYMIPTILQYE